MPKPKILVVDDDSDLRHVLRGLLEPIAVFLEAANGLDALRLLRDEKPPVMLLDVTMPGMDGISVLESALALDPKLTVVMLTGEMDLATAKSALDRGARAYVTKPFDPESLREEMARLIEFRDAPPDRPWQVRS